MTEQQEIALLKFLSKELKQVYPETIDNIVAYIRNNYQPKQNEEQ